MEKRLTGGCCCGNVTYSLRDHFQRFYFCHCKQCQKLTGSAHAANLFTSPDNITWLTGQDKIRRYDHPSRVFSKVFCIDCGSALPFLTQNKQHLIVPAGSLNDEPSKSVDWQIFCEEQSNWHKQGVTAQKITGFAP